MDTQLLTVSQVEEMAKNRSSVPWNNDAVHGAGTPDSRTDSRGGDGYAPSSSSNMHPIHCRMEAWKKRKEDRTKELRQTLDSVELQECSFHPRVRRASTPQSVDVDHLVNRLSIPKKVVRKSDVEELSDECTFTPDLGKSRRSFGWCQSYSSSYCKPSMPESEQFSHQPSTNDVRDNMLYCRAYLKENVFSRLARPLEQDSKTLESASRMSCVSAPVPAYFNQFLQRQNMFHRERDEWIALKSEMEDEQLFKPQLCPKSRAMVARRDSASSTGVECKAVTRQVSAPTFSFRPKIRQRSRALPRRSSYALSIGDQMKKEETIRKLAERQTVEAANEENEVLRASVSKPSAVPDDMAAPLRERVEKKKLERQKARLEEKQQREADLTKECSFKPKIKAAPAFVRRVAESYRLARQIQGAAKENPPPRVDWR